MRRLKILVLFDNPGSEPSNQDFTELFKKEAWATEADIVETLKALGHETRLLGIHDDVKPVFKEIEENKPDIIFNLTEVFLGKAYLEKNIPSVLELMQVPYTGCGAIGLMICNNKALTKKILTYHRIKVPNFHIFHNGKCIRYSKKLKFPLLVKPLQEEASTGIAKASFVENEKDLTERVQFIHEKFNMDALVEEYIDGRELYVSILGHKKLRAFPIREMKFTQVPEDEPRLATYKAKWDKKYREKWGIKNEFAGRLPDGIPEKITRICKRAYKALMIDGYGRFDLRLTEKGEIFILEANANPALARGDEFAESCEKAELSYDKLIQKIINLAFQKAHETAL